MNLITKDTTLAEFGGRRRWLLCCPSTRMVYKVEIISLNMRSTNCYAWVTQNSQGKICGRHVRLLNTPVTAIESRAALLHRLQTEQFEIW